MRVICLILFALVTLLMAVLAAEKPEIVYVHLNTTEEAEEVQKKILAEFTSFGEPIVTKTEGAEAPAIIKDEKPKSSS
ncbi:unnamed protein product [Hermetia illucens]|uniref:Uncharacterized protein n=1 Tax=Hermetia illucens TaxID=343691 RepID=A0A7R8YRE2_HERIL|nr:unnamed protein product [Hermetia illucens]